MQLSPSLKVVLDSRMRLSVEPLAAWVTASMSRSADMPSWGRGADEPGGSSHGTASPGLSARGPPDASRREMNCCSAYSMPVVVTATPTRQSSR
jgi:hypothetical protein